MSRNKGNMTENIAQNILKRLGHEVLHTNYYTKWGEIDIITQKREVIHIIEVKSTYIDSNPAENFSKKKLSRILKSVQSYCYTNNITKENIQIDLILINIPRMTFSYIENANLFFH